MYTRFYQHMQSAEYHRDIEQKIADETVCRVITSCYYSILFYIVVLFFYFYKFLPDLLCLFTFSLLYNCILPAIH